MSSLLGRFGPPCYTNLVMRALEAYFVLEATSCQQQQPRTATGTSVPVVEPLYSFQQSRSVRVELVDRREELAQIRNRYKDV